MRTKELIVLLSVVILVLSWTVQGVEIWSSNRKMVFPVWIALIGLSMSLSIITFLVGNPKNLVLSFGAGIVWLIVAFSSSSVYEIVVYGNQDHLKEFNFPYLVLLFGFFGLAHIIYSLYLATSLFKEIDMR